MLAVRSDLENLKNTGISITDENNAIAEAFLVYGVAEKTNVPLYGISSKDNKLGSVLFSTRKDLSLPFNRVGNAFIQVYLAKLEDIEYTFSGGEGKLDRRGGMLILIDDAKEAIKIFGQDSAGGFQDFHQLSWQYIYPILTKV